MGGQIIPTIEHKVSIPFQTTTSSAFWINHPTNNPTEYGVYHFRKKFIISEKRSSFKIHISADNKYRLFVNGKPICSGPATGDILNWHYETLDVAPYLKIGNNIIAAVVWNMGKHAQTGQFSIQTALIIQGNSNYEQMVNSNSSWKVIKNKGYIPCSLHTAKRLNVYMAIGPGDSVNGDLYPWNWEKIHYKDEHWESANEIKKTTELNYNNKFWNLIPRNIPLFTENKLRFPAIRRASDIQISADFKFGQSLLTILPNQNVNILLDHLFYTVSYPELIISNGKGSSIKLTYAESLFDDYGIKGNRNDITNKKIAGNHDIFITDGGKKRKFRPLWLRAYRYLQLNITTKEETLIINDIHSMETGYPLKMKASFTSNDSSLKDIWDTGYRTVKCCAGDVYYDTPYYEQLQYTGDSRIQALILLYINGDDRLMRKSILDFHHSMIDEGLTQSRYPSNRLQVIPAFSLFWISMIYDYWMHRVDDTFVIQFLPAISKILEWFQLRIDLKRKMLGPLNWWNFVDWENFSDRGIAPGSEKGNSSIITLQYATTLKQASRLFRYFKETKKGIEYKVLAEELSYHTFLSCYNSDMDLLADTPSHETYSQHAGIWAILSECIPKCKVQTIMKTLLENKDIGQVSLFYRFYLAQALKKADMGNLYYSMLTPWREMLKLGLTTFAEMFEPTRSDCHAWSASPNYDFLATICGIVPSSSGFRKVLIKPCLGELTEVKAKMPHPSGIISVHYKRHDGRITVKVTLPEKLTGTFIWNSKKSKLTGGINKFQLVN